MSEEDSGNKNKLILIGGLVIGFILVAALAVGGTLFFLSGKPADEEDLVNAKQGAAKSTSFYYEFDQPFVVPLSASSGTQRFMRISLAIKSKDESVVSALENHSTLVRARLLSLFSRQQYKTMQTPEGKVQVQLEARRVVQDIVAQEGKQIDEVLITDFVMQ